MVTPRFRLNNRAREIMLVAAVLVIAAGMKAALILSNRVPFNSDEAIVALMARHILNGERPIFFYGQAYMGSLDAWLVAGGFALFGQQVWVIRLVQSILYLLTILTTIFIGKKFLGSVYIGVGAGLLLAIPTVNVSLYTTASLGGYGEALLIGNLLLIVGMTILQNTQSTNEKTRKGVGWWIAFGILAGLGLWANALTLIFTIPIGLVILHVLIRRRAFSRNIISILVMVVSFFAGSAAWWWFAAKYGIFALIQELFGSAVSVEGGSWLARIWQHVIHLVLLGSTAALGFRPPWSVTWLVLPLIPLILFIWVLVFIGWGRLSRAANNSGINPYMVLAGVCLTLTAGFIFTSFGVDPSGRYFAALVVPFSLVASAVFLSWKKRHALIYGCYAALLIFNIWGTVQSAVKFPPGITTQFYEPAQVDQRYIGDLVQFLKSEGIDRGYTNYWVAYPLAFLSQEQLIFIPCLPYHTDLRYTERDDRYPPYQQMVAESSQAAYITTKNPNLDNLITQRFDTAGIRWEEKWIGDYHLFYNLSKPVRPLDIGLGTTANP